jgi:malate synthase
MDVNVITNELAEEYLDPAFYKFLAKLEAMGGFSFTWSHKNIVKARARSQERSSKQSKKPDYSLARDATDWRIELPAFLQDQRNQMTGPADDAKLCVKMINSHSPGVMLDLEDSLANTPRALLKGHQNVKKALTRELFYIVGSGNMQKCDTKSPSVVFTRVRGLHMGQILPTKVRKNHYVAASLFDLAYHFYDMDLAKLAHPPCIYIPKSESAVEAQWWRKAFLKIERLKGWKQGTIRCMALVESHSLAYEIDQFAKALQPYLVGFNLGRWDYMASLIHYNYDDPEWLFPDRNSIPSDVPFFQNLRHRMAQVCHRRGLMAIGGMTALYPSRKDPKLNERALKVLKADKENEAACLMDGAWTGHPDQNEIAVAAFPAPNQLDKLPGDKWEQPDLRDFTGREDLPITEEGTREAIRVCIQYRQGVAEGKGAKLINGYMEDLATDRIYRVMICQRLDCGVHEEQELYDMMFDEFKKLGEEYQEGYLDTLSLIQDRQLNPR